MNHNGKLDRKALPEPEFAEAEYVAPASPPAEEAVAAVYADLLGLDRVGVTESFFDLGGNSLSAARLAARVSAALGVEVSVRDVFDTSSVRDLVTATVDAAPALAQVVRVEPRPDRIPLSYAQQRMWFINQLDPTSGMYNIPALLRVSGALDVDALHAAVGDVVARHETLRTTFPSADGEPFQLVHDTSEILERLDWRHVGSVADIEAAVSDGFVLEREWPVRVRVWEAAPGGEHVVAVVMHHIASDGESFAPLVSDLVTAYLARSTGESPVFAPLEVQYADFALWQREVLGSPPDDPSSVVGRQLAYWTGQLAGLPDVLELPADRPRPAVASGRGVRTAFEIPSTVTERVQHVADTHGGVTPFMVLHAALAVTLSRLSGTDDIAVGTPHRGGAWTRGARPAHRHVRQHSRPAHRRRCSELVHPVARSRPHRRRRCVRECGCAVRGGRRRGQPPCVARRSHRSPKSCSSRLRRPPECRSRSNSATSSSRRWSPTRCRLNAISP